MAVLGAGNLRCGPAVLAGLATWQPDDLVDVRLWDTNEERLDLVDRLLRECLDKAGTEHAAMSTSELDEALLDATDVVLTVHEDCARRMTGRRPPELFAPEEPAEATYQVRGDPNRPTPPEQLSVHTHIMLSGPADHDNSREVVILAALKTILDHIASDARILSLERGILLPAGREHTHLNWPLPLDAKIAPLIPHQILRWIHGESSLGSLLEESRKSPLTKWLDEPAAT